MFHGCAEGHRALRVYSRGVGDERVTRGLKKPVDRTIALVGELIAVRRELQLLADHPQELIQLRFRVVVDTMG